MALSLCVFCAALVFQQSETLILNQTSQKIAPISKNTLFFKPQINIKLQNNLYLLDLLYGETLS